MKNLESDLFLYRRQLSQLAQAQNIELCIKRTLYWTITGGGRTYAYTQQGKYYQEPVPSGETVHTIIVWCGANLGEYHELRHAEQRLTNPHWHGTTLAQLELEATQKALSYPSLELTVLFNLLFN